MTVHITDKRTGNMMLQNAMFGVANCGNEMQKYNCRFLTYQTLRRQTINTGIIACSLSTASRRPEESNTAGDERLRASGSQHRWCRRDANNDEYAVVNGRSATVVAASIDSDDVICSN